MSEPSNSEPSRQIMPREGEYLPASAPPPPKRGWFRRGLGLFSFLFIMALIIGVLWFGRQWYDSLLVRSEQNTTVHEDTSVVRSGIHSEVKPQVALVYGERDGQVVRVLADAAAYSAFVNGAVAELEKDRLRVLDEQKQRLHGELDQVFAETRARVERFADWYFAYPTTYKLLWHASTSAASHAVSVEAVSLSDAVSHDLEIYLLEHYQEIVLRPEITDSRLNTVYREALNTAQQSYVRAVARLEAGFQTFVRQQTTHLETGVADARSEMQLDWRSQFHKLHVGDYEKTPEGGASGGLLALGGALAGKTVGSAAGKALAGKAIASSASKGVFAKLSAPFVSKAVAAGTGGAVGTLGGPLGSLLGVAGGLGVDYLLNEGVELAQRENFVADVTDALNATQAEWESEMQQALAQAIEVWFNDSIQLVPRYQN